jgi:hypothetical protein
MGTRGKQEREGVRLGFRCGSKGSGWLHESKTLEVGGEKKTSEAHIF